MLGPDADEVPTTVLLTGEALAGDDLPLEALAGDDLPLRRMVARACVRCLLL